jgi:hypothetical protein
MNIAITVDHASGTFSETEFACSKFIAGGYSKVSVLHVHDLPPEQTANAFAVIGPLATAGFADGFKIDALNVTQLPDIALGGTDAEGNFTQTGSRQVLNFMQNRSLLTDPSATKPVSQTTEDFPDILTPALALWDYFAAL